MPLVPITDQEKKRMMNELGEIDTLKNQLHEKKWRLDCVEQDLRQNLIADYNCENYIDKCKQRINFMTHNTIDDIKYNLKEIMKEISRMEKMLSETIAERSTLFQEISAMQNTIKRSHKKHTKLKKQVQAKKQMVENSDHVVQNLLNDLPKAKRNFDKNMKILDFMQTTTIDDWQRALNGSEQHRLKIKEELSALEQRKSDLIKEIQIIKDKLQRPKQYYLYGNHGLAKTKLKPKTEHNCNNPYSIEVFSSTSFPAQPTVLGTIHQISRQIRKLHAQIEEDEAVLEFSRSLDNEGEDAFHARAEKEIIKKKQELALLQHKLQVVKAEYVKRQRVDPE